jgi:hypothetical protein
MSLNALTNQEIARRTPETTRPRVARGGFVNEAVGGGEPADDEAVPAAAKDDRVTNALTALVGYIPTEVITLYVAALSAEQPLREATGFFDARWILWSFALLTPALLLLIYVSKIASAGGALPRPPAWPWWKMSAATIAFLVWAVAVPGNPYLQGTASAVAGLGAMLVSTMLHLVTPIFERPVAPGRPPATGRPAPAPPAPAPGGGM